MCFVPPVMTLPFLKSSILRSRHKSDCLGFIGSGVFYTFIPEAPCSIICQKETSSTSTFLLGSFQWNCVPNQMRQMYSTSFKFKVCVAIQVRMCSFLFMSLDKPCNTSNFQPFHSYYKLCSIVSVEYLYLEPTFIRVYQTLTV